MTDQARSQQRRHRETNPNQPVPLCGTTCRGGQEWNVGAWIAVAAAFLIRLLYLAETREVGLVQHPVGDAAAYLDWAQRIAQGEWIGKEAFYQAPLYPYVIGVLHAVGGASVWCVRLLQAAMGAASVGCLYYGTARLFDRGTGLLAAIMLCFYGPAIFFDGIIQKASLSCLLVCAIVAVTGSFSSSRKLASVYVVGVLLGFLILVRENALVWIPFLLVWVAVTTYSRGRGAIVLHAVLCAMGVASILAPVAARNAYVSGEWSVSTFQAGPNFYIGNHTGATGRYVPLVRGHETPTFERRDASVLAERATGQRLNPRQVSKYWMSRAVTDIRSEPLEWMRLMVLKFRMVWNRYEIADAESAVVYADQSLILRTLRPIWHFGILCPLAAMGIVATWRQWKRLWIYHALLLSMAGAVALFYVMARYRYPLVPLLIPFAATGSIELWRSVRSRELRTLVYRIVVGVVVAICVNVPIHDEKRLDALSWMNAGVALAERGEIEEATTYFQRAVAGHPTSAEANNNLGQALAMQGRFADAIPHYRAALSAEGDLMGVDYNLGVALERIGRSNEAILHYERALILDPSDLDAKAAIARLRGE